MQEKGKSLSGAQTKSGSGSDPIHGSLGPEECDDKDFANDEQRLLHALSKKRPMTYSDDPEHSESQESIKWAEKSVGEGLRGPNLQKESWWYFDSEKKENVGMKPGEKVDRGPVYKYSEEHD